MDKEHTCFHSKHGRENALAVKDYLSGYKIQISEPLLADTQFLRVAATNDGVLFRLTEMNPGKFTVSSSHLVPFWKLETARNHPAQFELLINWLVMMLENEKKQMNL